jgi:hypothetical protein
MASGEMSEAEFIEFLTESARLMAWYSVDGAIHFHCMDWRHIGELLTAGRKVYAEVKNICVWVKHNAGMGSLYRSQHELVVYSGFSTLIRRINARSSASTRGRPPNERNFQRQYRRKPARCQRTSVSGRMTAMNGTFYRLQRFKCDEIERYVAFYVRSKST